MDGWYMFSWICNEKNWEFWIEYIFCWVSPFPKLTPKVILSTFVIKIQRSKSQAPDNTEMSLYLKQSYEYRFSKEFGPSFLGWLLPKNEAKTQSVNQMHFCCRTLYITKTAQIVDNLYLWNNPINISSLWYNQEKVFNNHSVMLWNSYYNSFANFCKCKKTGLIQ